MMAAARVLKAGLGHGGDSMKVAERELIERYIELDPAYDIVSVQPAFNPVGTVRAW